MKHVYSNVMTLYMLLKNEGFNCAYRKFYSLSPHFLSFLYVFFCFSKIFVVILCSQIYVVIMLCFVISLLPASCRWLQWKQASDGIVELKFSNL